MRPLVLVFFLAFMGIGFPEPKPSGPAGMWNDDRVAENVGLYLIEGGRGDSISERCYTIAWSYDAASRVVTVEFDVEPHERAMSMRFRYDPASDLLTTLDKEGVASGRVFKRADQRYVDWWLAVKQKQEK